MKSISQILKKTTRIPAEEICLLVLLVRNGSDDQPLLICRSLGKTHLLSWGIATSHLNQIRTLLTRKKEGNVGWVSDRQYLPNTVHKQVTEEQIRLTNKPMKSSGLHWSSENYNLMVGGGREEERDREREYHTTIRLKKF